MSRRTSNDPLGGAVRAVPAKTRTPLSAIATFQRSFLFILTSQVVGG